MTTKNKFLFTVALAVTAFLVGFILQFLEARKARNELAQVNQRLMQVESRLKLAELRDLSGLMLLETMRRNYGSATEYSTRYFDRIREITTSEGQLGQSKVSELLTSRDSVNAALAEVDNPASLSTIQRLYERTNELTRD
jgi:septation ring formation regulator EzrA